MKWFKHYTDALDDPFIQELMDEFSHLGYSVWFGLIEIICKETGNNLNEKVGCSPKYLRRKLRTSQTKLREVFEYCRRDGRLLVDFSEKKWEFQIPKISEIKDNYTKDLQATSKKLSKHKEVRVKSKNKSKEKDIYGEFKNVELTKDEFQKLEVRFNGSLKDKIQSLSEYVENFPKKAAKYKSHYATILSWARNEKKNKGGKCFDFLP